MKVGWAKEQGENREEADEGFGAGITNDAMLSLSIQWGLCVFAVRYANVFIWRLFVCVFVCTSCSCRLKILVPWVTRAPQRWYLSFFKRRRLPALFYILLLLFAFFIFPPLLISIYQFFFFKWVYTKFYKYQMWNNGLRCLKKRRSIFNDYHNFYIKFSVENVSPLQSFVLFLVKMWHGHEYACTAICGYRYGRTAFQKS